MQKFRRKIFTIPEGHYSGPKDLEKTPGYIETIGKTAFAGAGVGTTIGGLSDLGKKYGLIDDNTPILGNMVDKSLLSNALSGAKYGLIAGIGLKLFLNHLHNPMTSVKFSEVDKMLRREFGVYRISGITIGDSIDKRASIDEKFGFNDRNVTDYKINIAIQDDKVTMYTFGMTKEELDKTSKILDYYCKKFAGMDYHSTPINAQANSYSVSIVFTNYKAITDFIMELSNGLLTRINLLDNKSIVSGKINDVYVPREVEEDSKASEKNFSLSILNSRDVLKIVTQAALDAKKAYSYSNTAIGGSLSFICLSIINNTIGKTRAVDKAVSGLGVKRYNLNNTYLIKLLNKDHYKEGVHYEIGNKKAVANISLVYGKLFITINRNSSDDVKKLDDIWKSFKTKIDRTESNNVVIYSYDVDNTSEFEYIIKKIMSTKILPNIFE